MLDEPHYYGGNAGFGRDMIVERTQSGKAIAQNIVTLIRVGRTIENLS